MACKMQLLAFVAGMGFCLAQAEILAVPASSEQPGALVSDQAASATSIVDAGHTKRARRRASVAFKLLEREFPSAKGNDAYNEFLGPKPAPEPDASIGLNSLLEALVAFIFVIVALCACCCVPQLEGATLGIAGTLEQRWQEHRNHAEVVK
eukprot:TRINITY_DN28049_c0_g2_i1.p1 TRINITY_DN28049_c0_g2~~TRINITY_DN28049_c0_g2_i1.p1  ORF type:complete len:151 (-),score=38.56 TRINITY_DN28049_c0_g2_i1:116-568(-)